MERYLFIFLVLFICSARGQSKCVLAGKFDCTGGQLKGIDFGNEDDDYFAYYSSFNSSESSCSIMQEGNYSEYNHTVTATFKNDSCEISETNNNCTCVAEMQFLITNNCTTVIGENGNKCFPVLPCEDSFSCPDGSTPINDPNAEPDTNGCGPESIPFSAPSFTFLECCSKHDTCYGTCGSSKIECDNEFYGCMVCDCRGDYSGYITEEACLAAACTYYEAVDDLGCNAFFTAQAIGCVCVDSNNTKEFRADTIQHVNKFGQIPISRRLDGLCEGPFEANCETNVDENSWFGIFDDLSSSTLAIIFSILCGIFLVIILFCVCCCLLVCRFAKGKKKNSFGEDFDE